MTENGRNVLKRKYQVTDDIKKGATLLADMFIQESLKDEQVKSLALETGDLSQLNTTQIRSLIDKDTIVDLNHVYNQQIKVRTEESDKYFGISEIQQKACAWFSKPPQKFKKNGRWFCPHPFHKGDKFCFYSIPKKKYIPIKHLQRSHVATSRKSLLTQLLSDYSGNNSDHFLAIELTRRHLEQNILVVYACPACNTKLDKVMEI